MHMLLLGLHLRAWPAAAGLEGGCLPVPGTRKGVAQYIGVAHELCTVDDGAACRLPPGSTGGG